MAERIAVVTGGNRGIGFQIVKELCVRFDGVVYLTARDVARGRAAVQELAADGLTARFHRLDVTDPDSWKTLADFLRIQHGGLDLLVNNAGVFFMRKPHADYEQAKRVIHTNYGGLKRSGEFLIPLMRENGRVVNLNAKWGHLSALTTYIMRRKFSNPYISENQIDEILHWVLKDFREGRVNTAEDYGHYYDARVAYVAAYALANVYAKKLRDKNIGLFAVSPSATSPDMLGCQCAVSAVDGAKPVLYAALDAPVKPFCQYVWVNNDIIDWYDADIPCAHFDMVTAKDPSPVPHQEIINSIVFRPT